MASPRMQPTKRVASPLEMLQRGNQRHLASRRDGVGVPKERRRAPTDAPPIAVVVACADVRSPIEDLFDASPGELYVVQSVVDAAGDAEAAAVELARRAFDVELAVVLAHSPCRMSEAMSSVKRAKLCALETAAQLQSLLSEQVAVIAALLDEESGRVELLPSRDVFRT